MIAVIDYGMGNLRSVQKALQTVGGTAQVTCDPRVIAHAEKIVFPGVGAFGAAMVELKKRRLIGPIKDSIAAGKPFLGLCLGLQLLFEKSEEAPGVEGLAILKGSVKRIKSGRSSGDRLKVPHMGWNAIERSRAARSGLAREILKGVPSGAFMYFVHSFIAYPSDRSVVLLTTEYGDKLVSGVAAGNVVALQFHPEKSQAMGLKVVENFVSLS